MLKMTTDPRTPGQLTLDIGLTPRAALGRADFVEGAANAAAAAALRRWRDWPGGRLALIGPAASGKTHLVEIWRAESGAPAVAAAGIRPEDPPGLVASGAVAVEDVDRLAELEPAARARAERGLFHLVNLAAEQQVPLLVTGRNAPRRWSVETPDLASRLQTFALAELAAPDDILLGAVLRKHFADRHLLAPEPVIAYLLKRMERSFAAALAVVEALDAASHRDARTITRATAGAVLDELARRRGTVAEGE